MNSALWNVFGLYGSTQNANTVNKNHLENVILGQNAMNFDIIAGKLTEHCSNMGGRANWSIRKSRSFNTMAMYFCI